MDTKGQEGSRVHKAQRCRHGDRQSGLDHAVQFVPHRIGVDSGSSPESTQVTPCYVVRQNSTWALWPRSPSLLLGTAGRQLWSAPQCEGWVVTGLGAGGGACVPALGSPGGAAWSPGSHVPGRWGNGCSQRMSPAPAAVLHCTPIVCASVASSGSLGTARSLDKGKNSVRGVPRSVRTHTRHPGACLGKALVRRCGSQA